MCGELFKAYRDLQSKGGVKLLKGLFVGLHGPINASSSSMETEYKSLSIFGTHSDPIDNDSLQSVFMLIFQALVNRSLVGSW